jgi:hypothetical protein
MPAGDALGTHHGHPHQRLLWPHALPCRPFAHHQSQAIVTGWTKRRGPCLLPSTQQNLSVTHPAHDTLWSGQQARKRRACRSSALGGAARTNRATEQCRLRLPSRAAREPYSSSFRCVVPIRPRSSCSAGMVCVMHTCAHVLNCACGGVGVVVVGVGGGGSSLAHCSLAMPRETRSSFCSLFYLSVCIRWRIHLT